MTAIKKLTRSITTTLFAAAVGEAFEWTKSVPNGERPRYAAPPHKPAGPPAGQLDASTVPDRRNG
jgi:hypothetical protein